MDKIEPVDIEIPEIKYNPRSKYRDTLDEFIESDMDKAKITGTSIADAERIQKGLKRHRTLDELILIERRGNVVWLVKLT